ncbi:MAG: M23 family metallopeptidase, partial [Bdellovibrionota bacterium]
MKAFLIILLGLLLSGCGNGQDPVKIIGDSTQIPTMSIPVATNTQTVSQTLFSAGHENVEWAFLGTTSVAVTAPADGIVVAVDSTPNVGSIRIYHNSQTQSILSKLTTVAVRVGDAITRGQALGITSTTLEFSMLINGGAICPYSF